MSKNHKNHGPKPGGNVDPKLVEAQKAQEKERERLTNYYMVFRTMYEIQCVYLGLEEVAVMEYSQGGVYPKVSTRPMVENQKERRYGFMEDRIRDFHAMTKKGDSSLVREALAFMKAEIEDMQRLCEEVDNPPKPNAAGLVGTDGVAIEKNPKEENAKDEAKPESVAKANA